MAATNPFTIIKQALRSYMDAHWDSLPEENPAKVKIGNRWRRERHAELNRAQAADLPEVDVKLIEGGEDKIPASSDSSLFVRLFELGVATDDKTPEESLDQCQWELIRVAVKAQREGLGLPDFIKKISVNTMRQTRNDPEMNRGRLRWSGAVVLSIQFRYATNEII